MAKTIENIAAKGAGKIGAVGAMAKGLRGVFVTIAEQHNEVSVLLSRAAAATDVEKRGELWTEIKKQLISHERAELAEVYPAFAAHASLRDIVQQHAEEANDLERTIMQIDGSSFDRSDWKSDIEALAALVKNHAAEEEQSFFPRAQDVLGDETAKNLDEPFMRAKKREMGRVS